MKILIADDERLVRLALKSMLEDIYPSKYTFIEAKNGQELIDLSKKYQPDICYVDINMPLLDGLTALKACKDNCPNTEWFILTGEAEFSFAKEAINIGVRDYLLKPVSINDLKINLDSAEKSILNKNYLKNEVFKLNILSLFTSTLISNNITENHIALKEGNYTAIVFFVDAYINQESKNKFINTLYNEIEKTLEHKISEDYNYALFNLLSGELCLIINSPNLRNITFEDIIKKFEYDNLLITPIATKNVSNLVKVYDEIKLIKEYSILRATYKSGKILYIEKLISLPNIDLILNLTKDIFSIYKHYLDKNEIKFIESLNFISLNNTYRGIFKEINIEALNKFLNLSMNLNLEFKTLDELLNMLISNSNNILYSNKSQNKDIIDEIMDYVKENYMKDIGVNTIANLYGITPNYLSKIFHEKSGMKFSNYITAIRIQESKKLILEDKSLTIKDVSKKVGYYSPRHFTKQFYKIEGYYPSDLNK